MTLDNPSQGLHGRSFKGRQLESSDFQGADLRGTDFSSARLVNANFRDARLGIPTAVGIFVLVVALVLSIGAGLATGVAIDAVRDRLYAPGWEKPSGAAGILIVLVVFVGVLFWKGLDTALKTFAATFAVVFALTLVARLIWGEVEPGLALRGVGLAALLIIAVLTGILGRVVGGEFGAWAIALVAVIGGLTAGQAHGGLAALVISVSMVLISKRALKADPRDRSIRRVAHRLMRRWGTRFVDADLTGADFTGTVADNCDITGAIVDSVTWEPGHAPISLADDPVPTR